MNSITPAQRTAIIIELAGLWYDENPIKYPYTENIQELNKWSDEDLLEEWGDEPLPEEIND